MTRAHLEFQINDVEVWWELQAPVTDEAVKKLHTKHPWIFHKLHCSIRIPKISVYIYRLQNVYIESKHGKYLLYILNVFNVYSIYDLYTVFTSYEVYAMHNVFNIYIVYNIFKINDMWWIRCQMSTHIVWIWVAARPCFKAKLCGEAINRNPARL